MNKNMNKNMNKKMEKKTAKKMTKMRKAQRAAKTFSPFMDIPVDEDFDEFLVEMREEAIVEAVGMAAPFDPKYGTPSTEDSDASDEADADEVITEEAEKAPIYKAAIRREQEENRNLRVYGTKNPNRAERRSFRKNGHMERISNAGVKIKHLCEEGEKKWVEYHDPKRSYKERKEAAKFRAALDEMKQVKPVTYGVTIDEDEDFDDVAHYVSFGKRLWKYIPEPLVDHSNDEACEEYLDGIFAALSKYIRENEALRGEIDELNGCVDALRKEYEELGDIYWLKVDEAWADRALRQEAEAAQKKAEAALAEAKQENEILAKKLVFNKGEHTYWERRAREAEARENVLKEVLAQALNQLTSIEEVVKKHI